MIQNTRRPALAALKGGPEYRKLSMPAFCLLQLVYDSFLYRWDVILKPTKAEKFLGMNERYFQAAIDELVAAGFIKPVQGKRDAFTIPGCERPAKPIKRIRA
jgi:hypothetical protein